MAIITKSPEAPAGDLTVTTGSLNYTLTDTSPEYHTTDVDVLSNARGDLRLSVQEDPLPEYDATGAELDQNDPHINPGVDPLSGQFTQAAKEARDANYALIEAASGRAPEPEIRQKTSAEILQEEFDRLGIKQKPVILYGPKASQAASAPAGTIPEPPAEGEPLPFTPAEPPVNTAPAGEVTS